MSFNIFAEPESNGVTIRQLRICGASGHDVCKVDSIGPGGRPIFFVDFYDQYKGFNYLEAAPDNIASISLAWCSDISNSIPAVNG